MQFLCDGCRCPLQAGQTMCRCGQVFEAVPIWTPNGPSNYWPWAHDKRPAIVKWLGGVNPAITASVCGLVALGLLVPTVGGAVSHYRALRGPVAPTTSTLAPVAPKPPVAAAQQPDATQYPKPIVLIRQPDKIYYAPSKTPPPVYAQPQEPGYAQPSNFVPEQQNTASTETSNSFPVQPQYTAAQVSADAQINEIYHSGVDYYKLLKSVGNGNCLQLNEDSVRISELSSQGIPDKLVTYQSWSGELEQDYNERMSDDSSLLGKVP